MLVPCVFQRLVTWYCQIPFGLMDVLVQTGSSWGPRAAGWGWWHQTSRQASGLMQSKVLYKVGWVSFILFHRWEIKAQEGFLTCKLVPPPDRPSCRSSNTEAISTEGWVCIYWVALEGLCLCWARKSVELRAGTSRTARESIHTAASRLAQVYVPQQDSSARQNTCVKRQTVPKQLQESSSWPLISSEAGLGGLILLLWKPRRMKGQEAGGVGHTRVCCWLRRKRGIFMFCSASFPALEKASFLCAYVNAL